MTDEPKPEPKKKRQYRKNTDPKPDVVKSAPSKSKLLKTYAEAEAERAARKARGEVVGVEAKGRAEREAEASASSSDDDDRAPVEKILCGTCGVSFPEAEATDYVDPDTGEIRVRCGDCAYQAKLAVAIEPAAPPALVTPGSHAPPEEDEDDDLDEVGDLERANASLRLENERLFAEASVVPVLRQQIAQLEHQNRRARELLDEARKGSSDYNISLEEAMVKIRDLEVLIGFEALRTPEAVSAAAPWMLHLAARLISDAEEVLDERNLTMLLVEAMGISLSQRTAELGRIMAEAAAAPAGTQLLELEQAVRHLSIIERTTPDRPLDEKAEALTAGWIAINAAAAKARDAIANRTQELMEQYASELHKPVHVPQPGEGRRFSLRRGSIPEPENEDP